MSIGFISSGTTQRTVDIYSGGGNRSVDISLQNVLNRFDKVKTDLDRLVDQAQRGTYDITSRQHYNSYNKESINGWSENWYAEYRAVLALRSDALQKKLQTAYNRVLERSAYAEMAPDKESVFAPYANRTYKDNATDTKNLNNKMRIANVLLSDTEIAVNNTTTLPSGYTRKWNTALLSAYLNSTSSTFPAGRDTPPLTDYDLATRAPFSPYRGASEPKDSLSNPADYPPHPPAGTTNVRSLQMAAVMTGVNASLATWPPPPTLPAVPPATTAEYDQALRDLDQYNASYDSAMEAVIQNVDSLLKESVVPDTSTTDDGDGNNSIGDPNAENANDYRDLIDLATFQQIGNDIMNNFKNGAVSTPPASTGTPVVIPGDYVNPERLLDAYAPGSFDPKNYQGMIPEDFRKQVPQFGMGDLQNLLKGAVPPEVVDTIDNATFTNLTGNINEMIQSFVGMQYNNIYKGNYYSSKPMAISVGVYGYGNTSNTDPFKAVEDADDNYPGGSIIQAGSTGLIGSQGASTVITAGPVAIHIGGRVSVGPDFYYAHQSAINNLSSTVPNDLSLPTVGLGGVSFAIGVGPSVTPTLHGGVVINVSFSYDILAKAFEEILKRLKSFLVEAMTVSSYATSSGVAMDSYAARAEYSFTQPGFLEATKALNFELPIMAGFKIPIPFGDLLESLMVDPIPGAGTIPGLSTLSDVLGLGLLDGNDDEKTFVNGQRLAERLFRYKHAVQGAESRETETGAFFATNAFLGQFEMSDMESEYWIGTQQNEEIVNMDLARTFTTAGPEIIKAILSSVASAMGATNPTGIPLIDGGLKTILQGTKDKQLLNIMYDLLYRDQIGDGNSRTTGNAVGQHIPLTFSGSGGNIIGGTRFGTLSKFTSEGYDYIENDHKPYEGDSDFNYKSGGILSQIPGVGDIIQNLFDANTPDFILEGLANTRRFTGTSLDDGGITLQDVYNQEQEGATGLGPRANIGRGYLNTKYNPDGNTDKGWADTNFDLGDINEVYTATRKVSFSDLTFGFGEFDSDDLAQDYIGKDGLTDVTGSIDSDLGAERETSANVRRYVGSDSRITERRYDGASGVNHETFTAGTYSKGANKKYYDRRNSYSLSFKTKADGNQFNLFGSQALNPTMGGFLKMATIDKNKIDKALVEHEKGGMDAVKLALGGMTASQRAETQNFGGTVDGQLNELNEMLYEHLHLRADGRNLSKVKEYRDVFETGLMSSIFVSGQTYHQSGGGITSSLEIRYDPTQGKSTLQTDTRESYDSSSVNFDPYNTPFLTRSRGQATMYLNNYFAYKKRSNNNKT